MRLFFQFDRSLFSKTRNVLLIILGSFFFVRSAACQTTTYYLTDSDSISGSATIWNMGTTAPSGSADTSTSVNVFIGAAGTYQFIPGTSTSNTLTLLGTFAGGGWETPALTGTLPAGICGLNVKLDNSSLLTLSGTIEARLLAGTSVNGSDAVTVSTWTSSDDLLSLGSNTTGTDSFPLTLTSPVVLTNEHLFLQVAFETLLTVDFGVTFICNESAESLVIPSIQSFTATPTLSNTPLAANTPTVTNTPTITSTNTIPAVTDTPTVTGTPTATSTSTVTPTGTLSPMFTNTPTMTITPTPGGEGYPSSKTPDGVFGANHNAFDPQTGTVTFYYNVTQDSAVQLILYNVMGIPVRKLVDQQLPTGVWSVLWDGRNDNGSLVAPDVYFLKIRIGNNVYLRKVAVIRGSK